MMMQFGDDTQMHDLARENEQLRAQNKQLRATITRAKDALLDGQSTQWVHDLLVAALVARAALEPKP
jgi:hypothetical protein